MSKVAVLLSTYNGESFLPELVQSLQRQVYRDFDVLVRDDGSGDATQNILRDYQTQGLLQVLEYGGNIGVVASFFELLRRAEGTWRYFAFCDQDDVWMADKIQCAVQALQGQDDCRPAMYCGRLSYVDEDLNPLGLSPMPTRGVGFGNALVENIASGCTIVLNRAARNRILDCVPARCVMHDWWAYLVVSALGTVVYDDSPKIMYRLHGANDVGAGLNGMHELRRRLHRLATSGRNNFGVHAQAQEFARCFDAQLQDSHRRQLQHFIRSKAGLWSRLNYAGRKDVYRQRKIDDLLLRVLIAVGLY